MGAEKDGHRQDGNCSLGAGETLLCHAPLPTRVPFIAKVHHVVGGRRSLWILSHSFVCCGTFRLPAVHGRLSTEEQSSGEQTSVRYITPASSHSTATASASQGLSQGQCTTTASARLTTTVPMQILALHWQTQRTVVENIFAIHRWQSKGHLEPSLTIDATGRQVQTRLHKGGAQPCRADEIAGDDARNAFRIAHSTESVEASERHASVFSACCPHESCLMCESKSSSAPSAAFLAFRGGITYTAVQSHVRLLSG